MTRSIRRPFLNTPEGCRVLCAPCKVGFLPCSAELLSLRRRSVADLLLGALLRALLGRGLLRGLLRGALLRGGLFRAALCCFLSCHSLLSAPFLVCCSRPQDTVANFSLWPRLNGAQHVVYINTMSPYVNNIFYSADFFRALQSRSVIAEALTHRMRASRPTCSLLRQCTLFAEPSRRYASEQPSPRLCASRFKSIHRNDEMNRGAKIKVCVSGVCMRSAHKEYRSRRRRTCGSTKILPRERCGGRAGRCRVHQGESRRSVICRVE